jgi:hypothetical protein
VEKIHPSPHRRGKNMHSADDKARAIKDHFQEHLGQPPRRECTLNWEEIPVSRYNLSDLDAYLVEEEIKTVVMHAPTEKVPAPDGFIDAFYMAYWEHNQARHRGCIKRNVCAARRLLKHPKLGEHYAHSQKARGHNSHRLSAYKCDA